MDTSGPEVTGHAIRWQQHAGKRVTLHAPEGSLAAQAATRYLRPADGIVDELEKLLDPPKDKATERVDIYMIDPLPEIPSALTGDRSAGNGAAADRQASLMGAGASGVMHLVQPEEPAGAMAPAMAELLVRRWFGPDASLASELVVGIGALAAARAGASPPIEETDQWVRDEITAGRKISIFGGGASEEGEVDMERVSEEDLAALGMTAPPAGSEPEPEPEPEPEAEPPAADEGPPPAAAASFVNFLIAQTDPTSLKRYFEAFTPARKDEAANAVFRRPLANLEEQWQKSMGAQTKGPGMIGFFKFIGPLLKPHMFSYIETVVYMVITAVFGVMIPLVTGCLVDALARANLPGGGPEPGGLCGVVAPTLTAGRLVPIVLILVFIYLLEQGIEVRRALVEAKLYNRIGLTLREKLFGHLLKLSHRFYGNARVGDVASRLSNDLDSLQAGVQQVFSGGVFMFLMSSIAAITALLKSWMVGLLLLMIVPVFVLANRFLGARIAKRSLELAELHGESADVLQESLSAHAVVKAYSLESRVMGSYVGKLNLLIRSAIRLMLTGHLYEGTIRFSTTLAQLMVLTVGSLLVINGTIPDPGTLVALMLLLPSIIVPMTQLADIGQTIQSASGSFIRAQQILQEPVDIADKEGASELPPIEKEIRFEDITFGYDSDRLILDGLNLTIAHGTNVAIVGPSGSGKSTVVNLLMRFWDPTSGSVSIDGHDLKDVTLESLRRQTGIVFQDTFVFNTTLKDNIHLARPDATDEEVMQAAEDAQLESLVTSLPQGFDTVLGERGVRMSGGQRQRLAIARALIRNPRMLILDEATSALDARTETEIRETIREVAKGRTTISITHRLSIAADADIVVVLDQGRVVEEGPHDELVNAGGLYQRLYEEQTGHVGAPRAAMGLEAARLKTIPLFSHLDPERLSSLAQRTLQEKFKDGEDIVVQGEPGDKLYLITRGAADVLVDDGGGRQRVNTLKEGDFFGEYALLTGGERTATVRTTQPTEVYSLSKDEFTKLVESDQQLQSMLAEFADERASAFDAAAEAAGVAR